METDGTGALAIIPNEARLYGKMARVMGIINRVPKSGNNTFHKYRYATADDVADVIREAMSEVNLALIPRMGEIKQETIESVSDGKTKSMIRTTIKFDFIFACGDTGATIISSWVGQVDDNSDKAVSKCATAAEKYFLMKTFIVSAGDEPDADSDKHREEAGRKVTPPANGHSSQPDVWHTAAELNRLAGKSYDAKFIGSVGLAGIEAMEALIAPKTWNDFANITAAAVAVKEAFEALQAMAQKPDMTALEAKKLLGPEGHRIGKPANGSPFDSTSPQVNPFSGAVEAPLTNAQLHAQALAIANGMGDSAGTPDEADMEYERALERNP